MVQISEILQQAAQTFSVNEALNVYQPLAIFVIGMLIYSYFIFKFYRFVARRDIFKSNTRTKSGQEKHGASRFFSYVFYLFKYIFFLPVIIFFWFIVLSVILAFLSKQEGAQIVLLISIALIATIRVMAYYNEDLSRDLAKMLPFALLGVFLVDISFFSIEDSLNSIREIPQLWKIMVYYLIFLVILEFILRIIFHIWTSLGPDKKYADESDER